MPERGLDELIVRENPGWPIFAGWIAESSHQIDGLPAELWGLNIEIANQLDSPPA